MSKGLAVEQMWLLWVKSKLECLTGSQQGVGDRAGSPEAREGTPGPEHARAVRYHSRATDLVLSFLSLSLFFIIVQV